MKSFLQLLMLFSLIRNKKFRCNIKINSSTVYYHCQS